MKYKFKDSQFKAMTWRVHGSADASRVKFSEHVPRWKDLHRDHKAKRIKAIKYFVYMYDYRSPLVSTIPVLKERKQCAAVLAGYDLEADKGLLDQIFGLTNQLYVDVVLQMIMFQKSRTFSVLVAKEEYMSQILEQLISPVTTEDSDKDLLQAYSIKAKLNDQLSSLRDEIDALYEELYGGDEQLQEVIEKSEILATPESYANRLTQ